MLEKRERLRSYEPGTLYWKTSQVDRYADHVSCLHCITEPKSAKIDSWYFPGLRQEIPGLSFFPTDTGRLIMHTDSTFTMERPVLPAARHGQGLSFDDLELRRNPCGELSRDDRPVAAIRSATYTYISEARFYTCFEDQREIQYV